MLSLIHLGLLKPQAPPASASGGGEVGLHPNLPSVVRGKDHEGSMGVECREEIRVLPA